MIFGEVRAGIRRLFRLGVRSRRFARADAEEELRSYVTSRIEQLVAAGYPPDDAHDEAIRRLGGSFEQVLGDTIRSAELREKRMSLRDFVDDLAADIRFAARGFGREKLVATFIIVTLALGIGANAAMFGMVDRLLISGPEHIVDPGRVMRFYRTVHREPQGDITTNSFGWVSYDVFRKNTRSFSAVAAYAVNTPGFAFGEGADAVLVPFAAVTYDFFGLVGVKPQIGRFFDAREDAPDAPQAVVVLGYGLWQRAFAGDPGVLGRKVTFGSIPYTVVGVAPRGFTGPQLATVDAWTPMSLRSATVTANWTTAWNAQWLRIIARVEPGVSPEQAATDATIAYRAAYTGSDGPSRVAKLFVAPMNFDSQGKETVEVTISRWLVGVAVVVLLIACSNVANLLLARAMRRRREVAVRIALGAGRGRLVRLLLTESTMLATAGATAGLAVAWATALLMRSLLLPGLEWPSSPVNSRVLVVSIAIAMAVGILTGLAPALRASRPDLTSALKAGAREGGGQSSRLRAALTIAQAALSIVLLVGAGLFVRSLTRVRALDLGIQPDRVLVVQPRYPAQPPSGEAGVAEVARRASALQEAMRRARALPGVENASLTIGLPFQSSFGQYQRVAGWDSLPKVKGGGPNISAVGDAYFATVGTRLLDGRAFTADDRAGGEPLAIVNKTMASTLWPGKSPVGECIYWGVSPDSLNVCSRIVGVVADAHNYAIREDPSMNYYIPFGQQKGFGGTSLVVRPRAGHQVDAAAALRQLMVAVDPSVSFVFIQSLQQAVDPQVRPWRLGAAIFTLMGGLALLVASLGLYSVMSYLVAQRTREIGVRIALGAQASSVVALIMRSGVTMVLIGVAIGTVIALAAGRFIEPLLFETSPRDPAVFGGVAAVLVAVAVLATVLPALRARRVDPMEALRSD